MTAPKQNWVQIPGALFSTSEEVNNLSMDHFRTMMDNGYKATFNVNDIFAFDGDGLRTMIYINRLNPHYGFLDIPLDKFSSIFFEEDEDEVSPPAVD